MIFDANIWLCSVDASTPHHVAAAAWLIGCHRRRTACRPAVAVRVAEHPLTSEEVWQLVDDWLRTDVVWIPSTGERTAKILGDLFLRHHVTENLVTDLQLVALAVEHGLAIASADSDFARFSEVEWVNPLR